ncbi:MAG: type II toxin-antitoxin system VapC family toxin [Planctomycetes bacterium]|nr:type II toxin-antitoxin system VapC family toxin [Planctomycetota bacterium]
MSLYVVDACVAAKWFLEEEFTDAARRVLRQGNRLHAPSFLLLEVDSLLCRRVRRKELSAADATEARARLRQLPIAFHGAARLQDQAFEMALRARCSPYDCLYIVLAAILGGHVVTADRKLVRTLTNTPLADYLAWVEDVP